MHVLQLSFYFSKLFSEPGTLARIFSPKLLRIKFFRQSWIFWFSVFFHFYFFGRAVKRISLSLSCLHVLRLSFMRCCWVILVAEQLLYYWNMYQKNNFRIKGVFYISFQFQLFRKIIIEDNNFIICNYSER